MRKFYRLKNIWPGQTARVSIKPRWIMVQGSGHECGIAANTTGTLPFAADPAGIRRILQIRSLINQSLFETADAGIRSDDPLVRSLGIAALSALSQRFLSCSAVRKRGYLSECWVATDPFIVRYPVLSRLVTKDDIVVIAGCGPEVRNIRGTCRTLHVMGTCPPDTFSTMLIGSSVTHNTDTVLIHNTLDPAILDAADVILIDASALANDTFDILIQHAAGARTVGLCGLGGSLIPDVFFESGLDFISSFRVTDTTAFCEAMENEHDMEYAMRTGQKQYLMMIPECQRNETGTLAPSLPCGLPGPHGLQQSSRN